MGVGGVEDGHLHVDSRVEAAGPRVCQVGGDAVGDQVSDGFGVADQRSPLELPGGQAVAVLAPSGMNAPVPRLAPSASMTALGMQSRSTFAAARRWGQAPSGFILVGFPSQQPDVAHGPHVYADGRDRSLGSAGSDGFDDALVLDQRTCRTTRLAE